MKINRVSIFDMDGTIVCSMHRYRTLPNQEKIDLDYWRENEYKAYSDSLLPLAEQYKADLNDPNNPNQFFLDSAKYGNDGENKQ